MLSREKHESARRQWQLRGTECKRERLQLKQQLRGLKRCTPRGKSCEVRGVAVGTKSLSDSTSQVNELEELAVFQKAELEALNSEQCDMPLQAL